MRQAHGIHESKHRAGTVLEGAFGTEGVEVLRALAPARKVDHPAPEITRQALDVLAVIAGARGTRPAAVEKHHVRTKALHPVVDAPGLA